MIKNSFNLFRLANLFFFSLIFFVIFDSLGHLLFNEFRDVKIFKLWGETTFNSYRTQKGWEYKIWIENGLIENLQAIILGFTIFYLISFYRKLFKFSYLKIFILLEILGLSFFFFEEISWGQHFIGFSTPNFLSDINNQNEFNLHNISNLFNELPKALVFIWCGLSVPIVYFIKFKKQILVDLIMPDRRLIYFSFVLIFFKIPNLYVSTFDLIDYGSVNKDGSYDYFNLLIKIISFDFIRLSELHELLFTYYFLWHSIFLKKKFK